MSELKSFIVLYNGEFIRAYEQDETDKVIAEKDAEIAELKRKIEFLEITHNSCGDCNKCADGMGKVFDETLKELKAENERLRGESCKLTDGCLRLKQCRKEKANIADELRATCRAKWLAREWRAWCEGQFWFVINGDEPRDVYHLTVTKRIHRTPTEWIDYWQKVEQKCKAKAEEYK